jgi:15-cis-phytoene synthase
LFAIDDGMADVVLRSTQPALGAIKLAWWRERLEELDAGKVPAEPRLRNAANELLPRGVTGAALAKLEDGWATLLEEAPDAERACDRGACLFRLGARLLKSELDDATIGVAGRLFAGIDLARRGLMDIPRESPGRRWPTIPRPARPLTALAALAVRDLRRGGPPFEREATPGRAWAVMYHRLTGRFPS